MTATSATTRLNALLERVDAPAGVSTLTGADLPRLARGIRAFLIERVCASGGHLGPNLGVVELTIALHRVFDSPWDRIVFDTGHQSYVHKILTGRRAAFEGLRQAGGLSGYPSRAESVHDCAENSHASAALSYACGLARGYVLRGEERRVVAVVGDGALTGGMCWEALNNLGGGPRLPVVVVLNDNGRSYEPTVGALAAHLAALRGGGQPCGLFGALGLDCIGPVDGHDIPAVEEALRQARACEGPVVVHCVTRKGRGHPPAEHDEADRMHAVGPPAAAGGRSWTQVFGEEIRAIGAERGDVVCLTAAMLRPTGLLPFARAFPDRVLDVGIAEQHAVTCAAGLAAAGLHPVVAIYSTFTGRAFDQMLMDVGLHHLPVTLVLDRAGITGPDGASHHGMWDLSTLPIVPGMRVAAPRDAARLRELLREAVDTPGPTAVRYPKATAGPGLPAVRRTDAFDVLRQARRRDVLLIAVGPLAEPCLAAARALEGHGIQATVVDPRWVAPVADGLLEYAASHRLAVTVEDNAATGGFGARLAHALAATGGAGNVLPLALPDCFPPDGVLPDGTRREILAAHGLDAAGITRAVLGRHGLPEPSR